MKLTLLVLAITMNICYAQKTIKTKMKDAEATVFINKDYKSRPYKKIIVYTGVNDAKDNEKILAELYGIAPMVNSVDLFPPVKTYTEDDVKKIYAENGIDGILKIDLKGNETVGLGRIMRMDITLTDAVLNVNGAVFNCKGSVGAFNSNTNENKIIVKIIKLLSEELRRLTI